MKYETNTQTENELFNELKTAIDAISVAERALKLPLEEEYDLYCQPYTAEFEEATKVQRENAAATLLPAREALDQFREAQYKEFRASIQPLINEYTAEVKRTFPNRSASFGINERH